MPASDDETRYRSLDKNDPHYTAVGRVASAWASFEFSVEYAIWVLADVKQPHGACMTAQIFAIPSLFKAYIALAELEGAPPEKLTALKQMLAKDVIPVGEERNRIVHDPWLEATDTGVIAQLRATADRTLDYRFRERSIEVIDGIWLRIELLRVTFADLAAEIAAPILQERQIQNELPRIVPPPEEQ